jgi:hypothetical protein
MTALSRRSALLGLGAAAPLCAPAYAQRAPIRVSVPHGQRP